MLLLASTLLDGWPAQHLQGQVLLRQVEGRHQVQETNGRGNNWYDATAELQWDSQFLHSLCFELSLYGML